MSEERFRSIRENLPRMSLEERDRRWRKIREEMAVRDLDCLLIWGGGAMSGAAANLQYATHVTSRAMTVFPRDGDPVVLYNDLPHLFEYWRATQQHWMHEFRPSARAGDIVKVIKELGLERGTIGVVGYGSTTSRRVGEGVPYRTLLQIHQELPAGNFVDESRLLEGLRMIKSAEEISFLERSAEIAYLVFERMVESARPGVKECEVFANMLYAQVSNGGEPASILLDSGSPPLHHGRYPPPTSRALEKGDIIIVEYHSSYGGYLIAIEHSISLGEPQKEFREIHRVCEEVYRRGVEKLRPGTPMSEVAQAFRAPVKEAGMSFIECGIHGHGLSSPEFPTFVYKEDGPWADHGLAKIAPVEVQENMVFGTNIDIHNPRWNKDAGLMLGDTILVTKEGPRKFSKVPLEFTIV